MNNNNKKKSFQSIVNLIFLETHRIKVVSFSKERGSFKKEILLTDT